MPSPNSDPSPETASIAALRPRSHLPAGMISAYAAGLLPPGQSLLVASHFTSCPCCRAKAARFEALGGAILAGADPVATGPRCLEATLARIEAAERAEPCFDAQGWPLPRPLCRRLRQPIRELAFRPVAPGLEACRLEGFPGETVAIHRAAPSAPLLAPGDSRATMALVLSGAARTGETAYGPGDCLVALPESPAAGDVACLCLAVQPA